MVFWPCSLPQFLLFPKATLFHSWGSHWAPPIFPEDPLPARVSCLPPISLGFFISVSHLLPGPNSSVASCWCLSSVPHLLVSLQSKILGLKEMRYGEQGPHSSERYFTMLRPMIIYSIPKRASSSLSVSALYTPSSKMGKEKEEENYHAFCYSANIKKLLGDPLSRASKTKILILQKCMLCPPPGFNEKVFYPLTQSLLHCKI